MSKYPTYRAEEVAGQRLWWEEIPAGLERYHIRLYYPDHYGNLRLVFINDDTGNHKCTIDAQTLMQEFGITYQDLGVSAPETQLREYEKLPSLDHLCTWPRNLYPNGALQAGAPAGLRSRLSPDICAHIAPARADAWI